MATNIIPIEYTYYNDNTLYNTDTWIIDTTIKDYNPTTQDIDIWKSVFFDGYASSIQNITDIQQIIDGYQKSMSDIFSILCLDCNKFCKQQCKIVNLYY